MGMTEKQAVRLGLGLACLVFLIIILVIVAIYPMKQFTEEYGFNTIEKINFHNTDVYYAIGGSLFNTERPDYVLVNDKLWYSTMFQSKLDYPVELYTSFQIFVGGQNITNNIPLDYIPKFTPEDRTDGISWSYYAKEEGRNKIIANLKFINSSNGVILHSQNKTTTFDVVSSAYALQDQSNKTTGLALLASILVGAFTVIALVISTLYSRSNVRELRKQNRHLSKQNKNLKEQFDIQNRPWVIINQIEPKFAVYENRHIPWDEYLKNLSQDPKTEPPNVARVYVSCTNVGKTPAKITEYRHTGSEKTTLEKLKQNKNLERMLFPNQTMGFVTKIPHNTPDEFFIAYLLEYSFDNSNKKDSDYIGMQWRIKDSDIFDLNHWAKN